MDRVKFSDVSKDLEFKFWMLISRLERFGAMLWIPSLLAIWSIHDHFHSSYLHGLQFGDNKDSGVYQKFWGVGARTTITLVPPPLRAQPCRWPSGNYRGFLPLGISKLQTLQNYQLHILPHTIFSLS